MNKIKLFLASSAELDDDKRSFGVFINDKNREWQNENIFIELTTWRDFISAISGDRTQNRYNDYIRNCHIVVILFHTKVGNYTHEEFDIAMSQHLKSGRNPKIYTYFKEPAEFSSEISKFKTKIDSLGQFYDTYTDDNDLYYKFNKQLDKLADDGFIKKERIDIKRTLHYALMYILLPALILCLGAIAYNYFIPRTVTVNLAEQQQHNLPFEGADITLTYADKIETGHVSKVDEQIIFKEVHAKYFGKQVMLSLNAPGYRKIDTTITLKKRIDMTLHRDASLSKIIGSVTDDKGRPIEGAVVKVLDLSTQSDNTGWFSISIPLDKQQPEQRLSVYKDGYRTWDFTAPIQEAVEWKIVLKSEL